MLDHSQLFARLAEGYAARLTIVTPNQRLAQRLTLDFDDYQLARGLTSWEAADILPFGAFVERLWEDALYSDGGERLPLLLTAAQEQYLWERILAAADLLIVPQAAAQCREAWRLLHAWRIPTGPGNEDALAFAQWSSAYRKQTEGEIDAARLPDLMAGYLEHLAKPALVVAYGFDVMPPQTREFLARFNWTECAPPPIEGGAVRRVSFPSAKHELEAAANWARARLEAGGQRSGMGVPELGNRRAEVLRIFSRVMQAGYNVPGQASTPLPFNISLGRPLAAYPLVDAALTLLELAFTPIEFARASHLLRAPFLGGADTELAKRASLDVRLRRDADDMISLARLIAGAEPAPLLRKLLEKVFAAAEPGAESPADWARRFSAVLEAAGFPGERPLDSDEFQTRVKWHEVLGELAKLERIAGRFAFADADATLKGLCDTLFQPESPDAPIQVLGVIESQQQRFDALWVSGLTDETWPRDARPNPFIPIALQKRAGIPQASAESAAALDRRITDQWQRSAKDIVFSHPAKDEDRDLAPSALIAGVAEAPLARTAGPAGAPRARPAYRRSGALISGARGLEPFQDARAPRVKPGLQ